MSEEKLHPFGDRHALCWPPTFDGEQELPIARLRASFLKTAPGLKTLFSQAALDYPNGKLFYSDRLEIKGVGVGKRQSISLGDITYVEMDDLTGLEELARTGRLRLSLRNNDEVVFPIDLAGQLWWPRNFNQPLDHHLTGSSAIIEALNFYRDLSHPSDNLETRMENAALWARDYGLVPIYQHWLAVNDNQHQEQPNPNIMTVHQFIQHWHQQGLI